MNKIMGRTLEDFKNRKYAVLCDTKEKARELCEILVGYGFEDESLFQNWTEKEKDLCIAKSAWDENKENTLSFSGREYYKGYLGMEIVEYELGNRVPEETYNLLELEEGVWYQETQSNMKCKLEDELLIVEENGKTYSNSNIDIRSVLNWRFKKIKGASKRKELIEIIKGIDENKTVDKIRELIEDIIK